MRGAGGLRRDLGAVSPAGCRRLCGVLFFRGLLGAAPPGSSRGAFSWPAGPVLAWLLFREARGVARTAVLPSVFPGAVVLPPLARPPLKLRAFARVRCPFRAPWGAVGPGSLPWGALGTPVRRSAASPRRPCGRRGKPGRDAGFSYRYSTKCNFAQSLHDGSFVKVYMGVYGRPRSAFRAVILFGSAYH